MTLSSFSCTCWPYTTNVGICIYSLQKCLFKRLAHLFNQVIIVFVLLICRSSLYILEINLLSDTWFANIFYYSLCRLFTLLIVFLLCRSYLVGCSLTYLILPMLFMLDPWNHYQDQCHEGFPLYCFLEVIEFQVLHLSL